MTIIKAKFNVDPNWKLMTTDELQSQQKAIKNLKSNNNNATFNSLPITEKNKLSTILAPAQIYKIIVCKLNRKLKTKNYTNKN